ncbi:hypothetical protein [Roseomonas xinghualingensis]|uniref:hypothetical protein n=1 Tax=Roseomonas xinghualingensis TaxID=2986475 RepID=UPI0021F14597|nr:hypothetical protein [Roseomonas sp. SXEYE001]MCV4206770.1 hypothetical protein [Roseomonas sp. SXEYE001]
MRPFLLLAGLTIAALPVLSDAAEARSRWEEEHRRWERHERREAMREERWRRERWREARRAERRYQRDYYRRPGYYGPPVAYVPAPQPPGVTLQLNLR